MIRSRVIAILLFSLGALRCGGGDYEVPLPQGYFIARVQAGDFCMVGPDRRTIVIKHVDRYRVDDHIVSGQIPASSGSTYFFVDTKSNSVVTNLTSQQWSDELKRRGVVGRELHRPGPLDAFLRK